MTTLHFFNDDDHAYQRWLADHPEGYVVNTPRAISPDYMVLHRASCRTISTYNAMAQPGGFTEREYVKACATELADLQSWVREHGRPDGTFSSACGFCKPEAAG